MAALLAVLSEQKFHRQYEAHTMGGIEPEILRKRYLPIFRLENDATILKNGDATVKYTVYCIRHSEERTISLH